MPGQQAASLPGHRIAASLGRSEGRQSYEDCRGYLVRLLFYSSVRPFPVFRPDCGLISAALQLIAVHAGAILSHFRLSVLRSAESASPSTRDSCVSRLSGPLRANNRRSPLVGSKSSRVGKVPDLAFFACKAGYPGASLIPAIFSPFTNISSCLGAIGHLLFTL